MKTKITMKEIKENYGKIIKVYYCEAQHLLSGQSARYYTCGIYGWNADIYEVDYNTVIVTGYRPFGDYEIEDISKLDKKAREIMHDYEVDYNKRVKKVNKLLEKAIASAKEVK